MYYTETAHTVHTCQVTFSIGASFKPISNIHSEILWIKSTHLQYMIIYSHKTLLSLVHDTAQHNNLFDLTLGIMDTVGLSKHDSTHLQKGLASLFSSVVDDVTRAPMDVDVGLFLMNSGCDGVPCSCIDRSIINRQTDTVSPWYGVFLQGLIHLLVDHFSRAAVWPAGGAHIQEPVDNFAEVTVIYPHSERVHLLTSCNDRYIYHMSD